MTVKKWLLIGAGVVVVAVLVIANLSRSSTPSVKARTAKVERGDVTARTNAPGKVEAVASVDLSAEVPGRVQTLHVAEGDSVKKDDLLLVLDAEQYRSRVAQAQAGLNSTRASLRLAEAQLDKLSRDKDRQEAMNEKGLTSAEALDRARTDYQVQVAQVEAQRQDVARMEASVRDSRDDLKKTEYRAPVSGVISRLNIEEGEMAIVGTMNNPGTVILTISDLAEMQVVAEVDEADIIHVAVGQKAKITVDAIPDTSFDGAVVSVGSSGRGSGLGTVDEAINFEVEVRFVTPDPRLKPGMTADVDIETETRTDVLTVPIQALVARSRGALDRDRAAVDRREKKGGRKAAAPADTLDETAREKRDKEIVEGVYKLVDGKATFVPVTSGIADDTRIEVKGELSPEDLIVSGPYGVLKDLKDGVKVKELKSGGKDKDKDAD